MSCRPGASATVTVISQGPADPSAVIFDAISAARRRGIDIVLADTAGLLPTQLHLMEEIAKVRARDPKIDPTVHETLLVLDANIGQKRCNQVVAFDKSIKPHRPVVTKLDGTAKGGVVASICPPVRSRSASSASASRSTICARSRRVRPAMFSNRCLNVISFASAV